MPNPHQHQLGITHLKILGCNPVGDPYYCDYRWNKDYTAYRVSPLLWWDDASYARYQSDDYYSGDSLEHDQDETTSESETLAVGTSSAAFDEPMFSDSTFERRGGYIR